MGIRKNGENILGSLPILKKKPTSGDSNCTKLCLKCVSDTVQQSFLKTVKTCTCCVFLRLQVYLRSSLFPSKVIDLKSD